MVSDWSKNKQNEHFAFTYNPSKEGKPSYLLDIVLAVAVLVALVLQFMFISFAN